MSLKDIDSDGWVLLNDAGKEYVSGLENRLAALTPAVVAHDIEGCETCHAALAAGGQPGLNGAGIVWASGETAALAAGEEP